MVVFLVRNRFKRSLSWGEGGDTVETTHVESFHFFEILGLGLNPSLP